MKKLLFVISVGLSFSFLQASTITCEYLCRKDYKTYTIKVKYNTSLTPDEIRRKVTLKDAEQVCKSYGYWGADVFFGGWAVKCYY